MISDLPSGASVTLPKEVAKQVPPEKRHLLLPTLAHEEVQISADEEKTCLLTPNDRNVHEITAVDGPAAILDILAPPYDGNERDCSYYRELISHWDPRNNSSITWLMTIPPPVSFWCKEVPYAGPRIDLS